MIGSYYQNGKPKNQRDYDKKAKHFAIPEDNVNELGEYFTGIPKKQHENEQLF